MEQLTTARANNQYITDYIKVADAKIAGFITISSAISGFILPNLYRWLAKHPVDNWYCAYWIALGLGTLLFLGTLICSLCALSPKTTPASSLVSFPDIDALPFDEYSKKFSSLTDNEILQEYLKHNKTLSGIAMKKFSWLKCATKCAFGWITIFGILYLVYASTSL